MLNKTIIQGRLTKNPEIKTTKSGKKVSQFSIACQRQFDEETDFFNCVAWQGVAVFINQYFNKGKQILIEGRFQNRKYTDSNGIERLVTELIVDNAYFCGDKKDADTPIDEEYEELSMGDLDLPF